MNQAPGSIPRPAQPRLPLSFTRAGVAGTILLALVIATCVRLGFWQLSRLAERRALNASIAARLAAPPLSDASALRDTAGAFYRVIELRGVFDNAHSMVLPGRSRRGLPGVHLLTPLRVAGRADAVLVNRGWVPAPDAVTIDFAAFHVRDTVHVRGLVLPFPGAAQSLAPRAAAEPADTFRRVWFSIDPEALRAQFPYPMLAATVQLLPTDDRSRHPARLEPPPLDNGSHLGYALQWFSFALIGTIGWFALVLRGRTASRLAGPAAALLLAFGNAPPAYAQLRPLDPLEWTVFDDTIWLVADAGAGLLFDQPAPLARTSGTLLEAGNYTVTFRSGRIAIALSGTAWWRMSNESPDEPLPDGTNDEPRQDAGPAMAATAFRISPDDWPDVVVRFGASIPTTSDETGLERDRTDFFALAGVRYSHGPFSVAAENGVGINGTVQQDYPQHDMWTYAYGAFYRIGAIHAALNLVGRSDGRAVRVRGNEDQSELRAGVDVGRTRWLRVRYVRGLSDFSPANGLRISGGFALQRRQP